MTGAGALPRGSARRFALAAVRTAARANLVITSYSIHYTKLYDDMVIECIELRQASNDRDFLNLRGEVLPFVRLRDLFEVTGERPVRENVVIVQYAGLKAGIVVDQLLGEFQTVIKPLSSIFRHLRGIGGSTILGTGEVALILDVQALIQRTAQNEENKSHAALNNRLLEQP